MSLLSKQELATLLREAADAIVALRAAQDRQSMQMAHDTVTIEGLNDKVMALLAENERLKAERDAPQTERDAPAEVSNELQETMQRIETKVKELIANRDQLQRDFTYMKQQRDFTYMKQQRDALQTQLESMQRQEPAMTTKEQVIELAKQAGGLNIPAPEHAGALERFHTLVRNAALTEAKNIIDTIDDGEAPEYRACQEIIESLKEPTP